MKKFFRNEIQLIIVVIVFFLLIFNLYIKTL